MDNVLGLSDDEFLKQNQEELSATEDSQESTDTVTPEGDITDETISDESNNATGDNQEIVEEDTSESIDADSNKEDTDTPEDTPQETDTFNYENAYNQVTAPFKANGATMQVKSPEDIVRLMQMGAGAQKQMAKLKPNLKLIKMLENNNLLDERRLNNLIDLSKNDSKAIAKLVKDSGVDPDDIDIENASTYQPNNDHMLNGVYDRVNAIMQQDKALGKLTGVSDVDAYKQIVDMLASNGELIDGNQQVRVQSNVESIEDVGSIKRKQNRKAAAPTKQTNTSNTSKQDVSYLTLSDDEFMAKYA